MVYWIKKRLADFSLIDYVFVLIFVAGVGFGFYKMFLSRKIYGQVFVDVTCPRYNWTGEVHALEYWRVDGLGVGDKAFTVSGDELAEIIEINKVDWRSGRRKVVDLVLKMRTIYDRKKDVYVFENKTLAIGDDFEAIFDGQKITGVVKNVYKDLEDRFDGYDEKEGRVEVYLREYEKWHAESLRDFEMRDSGGELVLEVEKIEIKPAEKSVETDRGQMVKAYDPIKKDVVLIVKLLKLLCSQESNICYFNYYDTVAIGTEFWADNGETWFGKNSSVVNFEIIDE